MPKASTLPLELTVLVRRFLLPWQLPIQAGVSQHGNSHCRNRAHDDPTSFCHLDTHNFPFVNGSRAQIAAVMPLLRRGAQVSGTQ
jgi:hypothetical protein